MTKFEKPGGRNWDYPDMAKEAVNDALIDAGLPYEAVQQACVGYCYGDSTCGQRALYGVGLTGIPIYNVNNNCSTGSTALFMAKQFIEGGLSECVLALGFEKMERGSLGSKWDDRTNPMDQHVSMMMEVRGFAKAPVAPQMFGNAGREHMDKYGTKREHFAKIAEKNHRHSAQNPRSQFRDVYTLEQIMKSKAVYDPLTMLQCCPTSEGAAAAILCSESFVYKYGLQKSAIEIAGMHMTTDRSTTFEEKSMIKMVGFDMTQDAAQQVYKQSGLGPQDIQVIELHDCFSCNELITYEALGLCEVGQAKNLIDRGDNTYGGKWVVNPSGGLISKGHPLGATGLAQCAELCWQLRNMTGPRQVPNAKVALQHNVGLGGAVVVTLYKKPSFQSNTSANLKANRIEFIRSATLSQAAAENNHAAASAAASTASPVAPATSSSNFKIEPVLKDLSKNFNAQLVQSVGVVYKFDITSGKDKKTWIVDLKNGTGSLKEGDGAADCTLSLNDNDCVALMSGKLNPQQAFMKGQLKIKGNMMAAQKLANVVPKSAKL